MRMDRSRWVIVLAGGDGTRLSRASKERYGYARPKQFCDYDGSGTLLEHTMERALRVVPEERVVVVITRGWEREADESLRHYPRATQIVQPRNLGTGPGILLPLLHILQRDPHAGVLLLPSDHHIEHRGIFSETASLALDLAEADGSFVTLLGAEAPNPEEGYGWILSRPVPGRPWSAVTDFVEKPPPEEVVRLWRQGALVNTFILAGRAITFSALFAQYSAGWWRTLTRAAHRPAMLEAAYSVLPESNFSRAVLAHAIDELRVLPLRDAGWSDIGTPDRLERVVGPPNERVAWLA